VFTGSTSRIRNANQVKYCAVITLLNATNANVCTNIQAGRFVGANLNDDTYGGREKGEREGERREEMKRKEIKRKEQEEKRL
jgi:hypothetical protein